MQAAGVTATAGVLLLLLAFALNVAGRLERRSLAYQSMNVVGASLSCYAAVLIAFWPFVVLEGCWTAVAAIAVVVHVLSRRKPDANQVT
ncbi:MAG: hypothetical protein DLM67_16910 [Candidatus Nephthysia bennettiae]|nr:MAG: hypothetical protein DLM67_16910 [Candidatus Dormibacteraeota bacterium]